MSDKNGGNNGSDNGFWNNPFAVGAACIIVTLIVGSRQIKQGYILGTDLSREVLKRHDKEVKRFEKQRRREQKQALKEKRRQERLKKSEEP